jgi:hypothetical protein
MSKSVHRDRCASRNLTIARVVASSSIHQAKSAVPSAAWKVTIPARDRAGAAA